MRQYLTNQRSMAALCLGDVTQLRMHRREGLPSTALLDGQ